MSFCCNRTVSLFCGYASAASVPGFFLRRGNASPKTATFGRSSFYFSLFSSCTALSDTVDNWKNKFLAGIYVSSVEAGENTTPSIVDIAPNSVVKTTPSTIDWALKSVVKVFTSSSKPKCHQPWINTLDDTTGSGFVISGKKILTNAHVVADHKFVKVRKDEVFTKYKAKVLAIGHECDLAILEVDSEEFWEGMNSLEIGDIPSLLKEVVVIGYPEGGDTISVTKGVVSRVELLEYSHSNTKLLAIQIDAAINSGNSGGPVIMGDKVVGVAFESLCDSDNIGYIISTPVIKQFLNGIEESGRHVSFCSINLLYQTMENSQHREFYKMKTGMTGVLINQINPLSDAHNVLEKNDVILAIDGVSIGNDGTVPFPGYKGRINVTHLVSMKRQCDTALFKVLREGKEYEFNISLKPAQRLVPVHQVDDKPPSYYIFGGLVFVQLTQEYIDLFDVSTYALEKMPTKVGEQIVIVAEVLEDDINTGYSEFKHKQVKKVNGVEVDNLTHLCELIEECDTEMLELEFEKDTSLVLNYDAAGEATDRIVESHNIPSCMSDDLKCHLYQKSYSAEQTNIETTSETV